MLTYSLVSLSRFEHTGSWQWACPDSCPYLHICNVVPPSTSGVWQQVHQHFLLHFLMAEKKFQIFRGWGAGLFCSAGESCLNTTDRQEITAPRTIGEITAPGGTTLPREGRVSRNKTLSPSSSAVTSSRVNGQTGNWQLSPLASTPLWVWGVLVGAGGGGTPRKEKTTRREEGAGSLRRFQPEGAGGLATAPRTS